MRQIRHSLPKVLLPAADNFLADKEFRPQQTAPVVTLANPFGSCHHCLDSERNSIQLAFPGGRGPVPAMEPPGLLFCARQLCAAAQNVFCPERR
jgi:hypothetical protein